MNTAAGNPATRTPFSTERWGSVLRSAELAGIHERPQADVGDCPNAGQVHHADGQGRSKCEPSSLRWLLSPFAPLRRTRSSTNVSAPMRSTDGRRWSILKSSRVLVRCFLHRCSTWRVSWGICPLVAWKLNFIVKQVWCWHSKHYSNRYDIPGYFKCP